MTTCVEHGSYAYMSHYRTAVVRRKTKQIRSLAVEINGEQEIELDLLEYRIH